MYSGGFIKHSGSLHLSPLSHPSFFFPLLLCCLTTTLASKGRLLGPTVRGLRYPTEINAPKGTICLIHVCLVDSTFIQGATEHVQERTAQWRFIYLPPYVRCLIHKLSSKVEKQCKHFEREAHICLPCAVFCKALLKY